MTESHNTVANLRCSFCGKSQAEVQKVIAGEGVAICTEYLEVCNDIVADTSARRSSSSDESEPDDEPDDEPRLLSFKCPACGHHWKAATKR